MCKSNLMLFFLWVRRNKLAVSFYILNSMEGMGFLAPTTVMCFLETEFQVSTVCVKDEQRRTYTGWQPVEAWCCQSCLRYLGWWISTATSCSTRNLGCRIHSWRGFISLLLIEAYMVLVAIVCGYDCSGSQMSFQYLSFTVCTWFHSWPWLFESSIWSEWLFNEWMTIQFPSWSKPKDAYKTSFSACTAYASRGHLGWGFWEDKAWGWINQWLGWWIL